MFLEIITGQEKKVNNILRSMDMIKRYTFGKRRMYFSCRSRKVHSNAITLTKKYTYMQKLPGSKKCEPGSFYSDIALWEISAAWGSMLHSMRHRGTVWAS